MRHLSLIIDVMKWLLHSAIAYEVSLLNIFIFRSAGLQCFTDVFGLHFEVVEHGCMRLPYMHPGNNTMDSQESARSDLVL